MAGSLLELPRRSEAQKESSAAASPHNLPIQLTSFIGREWEQAEVRRLLATNRLLTLTGPGGCGKTRLALKVAADLVAAGAFADGVWWVDLTSLADPALALHAVAVAVDVREQPGRSLAETVAAYLELKDLLLILDNCEHLVAACAQLAEALLHACPRLRILATSREALNSAGETAWLVPSLSLPDLHQPASAQELAQYGAIRLFAERATAVQPAFRLTDWNIVAAAQVCLRLDGIPLAIELAAVRVKVLAVEQVAARLDDCFQLLTLGSSTALPRHQTLRATMDWSYDLLSEQERMLFCRLSIFSGSWTLEAAEAVCAGDGVAADAVLDLLTHLVDKSLVVVEIKLDDARRYRLLEPVRQYAREKLRESGEAERMNGRHVAFFLQLVEAAEPQLHAPEQIVWLDRLEAERANLYAALQWLLNPQRGDPEHEAGVRLAGALLWFWWERGDFSAGRRWLEACLAYCNAALQRTSAQAKVLKGAGCLAGLQGDYALARACLQESATIWQELGDAAGVADVRTWLTIMALEQGDYATARPMAEESVALARSTGDSWLHAHALFALGWAFRGQGDYALARAHYEQSVRLFRSVGDKWGLGLAVLNLGIMAYEQADYAAAQLLFEERLAIGRAFGSKHFIAAALEWLGNVALHTHDYGRAVALLEESLTLHKELGRNVGTARCLIGLGAAAAAQGQPEHAARRFAVAENLLEAIEARLAPVERAEYEHNVAAVRALLSEEAFAAAWAAGRALPREQAIAYALAGSDRVEPATPPAEAAHRSQLLTPRQAARRAFGGLTAREREVVALIAQGHSNAAIAATLVVGVRTVEAHITRILAKLGFSSRAQVAAWAVARGLAQAPQDREAQLGER